MRLYFAATVLSLGAAGLIVNACMFRDTPTRSAPVNIAHLR